MTGAGALLDADACSSSSWRWFAIRLLLELVDITEDLAALALAMFGLLSLIPLACLGHVWIVTLDSSFWSARRCLAGRTGL